MELLKVGKVCRTASDENLPGGYCLLSRQDQALTTIVQRVML